MVTVNLMLEATEEEAVTRHGDVKVLEVMLEAPEKILVDGTTYSRQTSYPVSDRRIAEIIEALKLQEGTPPLTLSTRQQPGRSLVYYPQSPPTSSSPPSS